MKKFYLSILSIMLAFCLVFPTACNGEETPPSVENTASSTSNISSTSSASVSGSSQNGAGTQNQLFTKVDQDGVASETGDYVFFGSYPQTEVTDETLKADLNALAGTLPVNGANANWTSYKYYSMKTITSDYMWYIDVEFAEEKYRGVYYDEYRPTSTTEFASAEESNQDDNGYLRGYVYWFKYEPIKWKIILDVFDTYKLLCEDLIDSQAFQNNIKWGVSDNDCFATDIDGNILKDKYDENVYANNYQYSTIRTWLNDNFYNTAFNADEKEIIDITTVNNSHYQSGDPTLIEPFDCENTEDKVFLLNYAEATEQYSYINSTVREKNNTDYAMCQGAWIYQGDRDNSNNWWLRTPSSFASGARFVTFDGDIPATTLEVSYLRKVMHTYMGVCPAIVINL